MEYVKLNNGVEMPILNFGVYQIPQEETKLPNINVKANNDDTFFFNLIIIPLFF